MFSRPRLAQASLLALALALPACPRGTGGAASDAGVATKGDAGPSTPNSAPSALAAPPLQPPALSPPDAGPLDDSKPGAVDPALKARLSHLIDAIAHDDPGLAGDLLFPRDAFVSTSLATEPGKEWDKRVNRSFKTTVHALSKRKTLHGIERAQVVAVEIGPMSLAPSGKKGWKLPLWVASRSKLVVEAGGKTFNLHIAQMTSWRGAWYITRLGAGR